MHTPRRSGKNSQRTRSILVFSLAILFGLFAVARRLWVAVRVGGVPDAWDIPVLEWFEAHRTAAATAIAWFFTIAGDTLGMSLISLVLIGLFSWRTKSAGSGVLIAVTAAGSVALTLLLKTSLGRARPPLDDALPPVPPSFSFPSGHTLNSVAILGVVGYLALRVLQHRLARIVAMCALGIFIIGVAVSRLYLGHHWLSDVFGGLLIGGCWAAVVIVLHHFVLVKNRRWSRWLRT